MRSSPRKFVRPSVSLTGQVSREWRDNVPVMALSEGDLVADKGAIKLILAPNEGGFQLLFVNGSSIWLGHQASVRAAVPRTS